MNRRLIETTHPSYQAWSYASLIQDYNENAQNEDMALYPCAYLHNYLHQGEQDPLTDPIYDYYIKQAPVFIKGQAKQLRDFIKRYIKVGDNIEKLNETNNKSRLVAGYCWNWVKEGKNNPDHYDIVLPEFNFEISWNHGNSETWAINEYSIREAGCIHTCQGLEFDYVGVIIGDDMRVENGVVVTDFTKRAKTDSSLKGIKKMMKEEPDKAVKLADELIRNTYRTLMTRGQKGCFVYCTDPSLAFYLKERYTNSSMTYEQNEFFKPWSGVAEERGEY
ncbi:DUF2075 domain-containing protein [Bacillus aerolatus]|uniref:DUF2075 domain-containing protein n=1 Tax=Bacillus aerolatus TaxID=2653354 RepID=A0A6I1FDU1_9BACI|nr:DUF2075 domain-containing protein [Bacillus aerolatus]